MSEDTSEDLKGTLQQWSRRVTDSSMTITMVIGNNIQ